MSIRKLLLLVSLPERTRCAQTDCCPTLINSASLLQAGLSGAQAKTAIGQVLQNLRSFALTVEGDDSVALTTRAVPASEAASEAGTDPPASDAVDSRAPDEVHLQLRGQGLGQGQGWVRADASAESR